MLVAIAAASAGAAIVACSSPEGFRSQDAGGGTGGAPAGGDAALGTGGALVAGSGGSLGTAGQLGGGSGGSGGMSAAGGAAAGGSTGAAGDPGVSGGADGSAGGAGLVGSGGSSSSSGGTVGSGGMSGLGSGGQAVQSGTGGRGMGLSGGAGGSAGTGGGPGPGTGGASVLVGTGGTTAGGTGGAMAPSGLAIQYIACMPAAMANGTVLCFKIINRTTATVALTDLTVRYYLTIDGGSGTHYVLDSPNSLHPYTIGAVVPISPAKPTADTYIEISFTAGAPPLAGGTDTGEIKGRIFNDTQPVLTQTNDYSFDATKTAYADWSRMTIIENMQVVWGTPP